MLLAEAAGFMLNWIRDRCIKLGRRSLNLADCGSGSRKKRLMEMVKEEMAK
jgi:hypothetical protein